VSEKRRAGIEVLPGVSVYSHWLEKEAERGRYHVVEDAHGDRASWRGTVPGTVHPAGIYGFEVLELHALTEPIPEEPDGPRAGDEVDGAWLDDEWEAGRFHVVRNPDGSAGSWGRKVEGTERVYGSDGDTAGLAGGPWPLLALHPVERWEEPEPEPEEPEGPQVGDEVTWEWLRDERRAGRFHVVRNKYGRACSSNGRIPGTEEVGFRFPYTLLALHPVERWEEPEANPTPPVDPVEEPEILFCKYRLFRQPDGTLRDQHGDTWRGSLKEGLIGPMKDGVDYTIKARPLKPVDPVEEAWAELALESNAECLGTEYIRSFRAAVEATVAPLRDQVQALSDRVAELEEQIIDLRNRGATRPVRTVRNPKAYPREAP